MTQTQHARTVVRSRWGRFERHLNAIREYCVEEKAIVNAEGPYHYAVSFESDPYEKIWLPKGSNSTVSYTVFTATATQDELAEAGENWAQVEIVVASSLPDESQYHIADVIVVEETETHYRLRFAEAFAAEHPELCSEWVEKTSSTIKITR